VARVRWNTATLPSYVSSMWSNTEDWQYIRKAPELVTMFEQMGGMWVSDLNRELHAAQAARKQKVEDGYAFAISHDNDRLRMRIWAFTARAMVHEAKHQSILKLMRNSGFDFKGKGRAQWDWGRKKQSRSQSGGSRSGAGTRSSGTRKERTGPSRSMSPGEEAKLRRRLAGVEALAARGATEGERSVAAEKARRIRRQLGDD
jgi:hypothetical protein